MHWRSIQRKNIDGITAHLVAKPDRSSGILIERNGWRGLALFTPAVRSDNTLQHAIVQHRYDELETEADVEDLLREWSDPEGETLVGFIETEAQGELSGADDLPDLIVPADLVRGSRKAPRGAPRAKTQVREAPPYSPRNYPKPEDARPNTIKLLPITQYDHIIVSFSGGKDSVACALLLLEMGIPAERIELWHQAVDGEPGKAERFWDWPVTEAYCEAFAKAFGFKLLFQWKDGGYLGELTRRNVPTAPTTFQLPDGRTKTAGGGGPLGTRLAFPAMDADLKKRWCSSYVKIDVAKKVFGNDPRFTGAKTLILTGERRQESGNRARYEDVTDYASTQSRTVHQWRAVLGWFEQDVWEIIEKYHVRPHPAYSLGWSRVSCLPCIFGNSDQWASVKDITPEVFDRMAKLEDKFHIASKQISTHVQSEESQRERHAKAEAKRRVEGLSPTPFKLKIFNGYLRAGESLPEAAERGTSYITPQMREDVKLGMSEHYTQSLILKEGEVWKLPVGAYKHSGGPT